MGAWGNYVLHPDVSFAFINSWGCTYNPFALYFGPPSDPHDLPKVARFEAHAQPHELVIVAPEFVALVKEARRILLETPPLPGSTLSGALSFLQSPCDDPKCLHALSPCSRCGLIELCTKHQRNANIANPLKHHRKCPHCARPSHRRDSHGKVCAPSYKTLRAWRNKHSTWLDALRYAQERIPSSPNPTSSRSALPRSSPLFVALRPELKCLRIWGLPPPIALFEGFDSLPCPRISTPRCSPPSRWCWFFLIAKATAR